MRVLVLNGPNLNLLGTREPEVYGTTTLADLEMMIRGWGERLGVEISFLQSNSEGDLVEAIQQASGMDGIVLNPGALTHTSRSIGDAIRAVGVPAVEVHISNVKAREPWRSVSLLSDACARTIYGRGFAGYRDALRHLANRMATPVETVRYGPHQDNVVDMRHTDAAAKGLVILVHGGFWMRQWERDSMESLAVDLTGRGHLTANLEYRRLGTGGGWPGSAHDVQSAVRFLGRHPGSSGLATAMIGHSAGGHLALWAVNRSEAQTVDLVVGLGSVTDLELLAASTGAGAAPARSLLDSGAPPRVGARTGRTLLIHGEDDAEVPVAHSTRLGEEARVEVISGLGHFEMLDPARSHWPLVTAALDEVTI